MIETFPTVVPSSPVSRARRVPGSTYRLQLNSRFGFQDALEITDYLYDLGITDCYASPIFAARPGSSHGYDVCDSGELNPDIGSPDDFDCWSVSLRELGMGILLDIVPNHMGADPRNPWWRDVLQHGPASSFAHWFDICWQSADKSRSGRVLLPILEDHYWKVLEAGKLQVLIEPEGFVLGYHEHRLPLSPESIGFLESEILRRWEEASEANPAFGDINALKTSLSEIVSKNRGTTGQNASTGRTDQHTLNGKPEIDSQLTPALKRFNGTVGAASSFDGLHALLQKQYYQLGYWRLGNEELNYRRFFDIPELVGMRMELLEVFEATHAFVLRLLHEGKVTGLRIDHPDGLWNPAQYFSRLQQAFADMSSPPRPVSAASAGTNSSLVADGPSFYIVAEKILSTGEALPVDWPIAGTTGYDFLNLLNGLFINRANREAIEDVYKEFAGPGCDFGALVYQAKLKVLHTSLRGDVRALGFRLRSIAAGTRYGIDFSESELQEALAAIIAAFPVYRTYMTEEGGPPAPEDASRIDQAVEAARRAIKPSELEALSFIESLLLLKLPVDLDESARQDCHRFVMKFQQLTGPVMAKGLEDTTFYRYNRFISLNEVGGAPDQFGVELDWFHRQNLARKERWPHSLLATATHDTKRGEDLRARLNVLSEMPEEWRQAVLKWRRLNAGRKTIVDGLDAPDANDEYFFYQTLVGAWSSEAESGLDGGSFRQRLNDYMLKAIREAKVHTSWAEPNQTYEKATRRFVEEVLSQSQANAFLDDFMLFQRKVAFFGLFNSLAQVVLKMTSPGVPDFYQGTELWDYNLVDPDNRRPVDYQTRKALLAELREKFSENESDSQNLIKGLLKNYQTGQIKLYIIWRILELRNRHPELFEKGDYVAITPQGSKPEYVCAFARSHESQSIITVTARLVLGLTNGAQRGALDSDVWQDTSLPIPGARPGSQYKNVLTQRMITIQANGASLPIPEVLGLLPVAVLERII